ncbi:MAG: class I SAM-dependent methyltransferase [Bacteroidales bacterium]|nr:class I SAM-dependent methyltransferase [Bacteroidales bacterium]MBN2764684.1 class I SAM-dependent methyltransferase [Bacteroidales bacterium]
MIRNPNDIKLGSVQETLLLPLWGRAVESQKRNPLLMDSKAVAIIDSISYDFSTISKNINNLTRLSWIARSIYFDKKIKAFIKVFPEATIVNIGCGLDTTFDRVDNGTIHWIDLDLPDTIELRRKYISETDRNKFISKSVFDTTWYDSINKKDKVMLLIAGVLYYFDESDIKKLFHDFHIYLPGVEVIFDYASKLGINVSNKIVLEKGGMDKSAVLKWGIDKIKKIEKWDSNIKVIDHMLMYKEHRKNYSIVKRMGMTMADILKIMSLAHIRIN